MSRSRVWLEAGSRAGALASALAFLLASSSVFAKDCSRTSSGHIPLNDLGTGTYNGSQAGLYPGGTNERPVSHDEALDRIGRMTLLDAAGNPNADTGVFILMSIGNSNANREFQYFTDHAPLDPQTNSRLMILNGAQVGKNADEIANPLDNYWTHIVEHLAEIGLTPLQVQAIWVEEAIAYPTDSWPDSANSLLGYLRSIMKNIKTYFPNVRVIYQASRIYGGYGPTSPSHEPWCYEYGFSTKWLIEAQLNGDPELNFDPAKGPVLVPWLAWGPYLWADGLNPRSDGLIWECEDFLPDGKHPSESGNEKIYDLLIDFFKNDPTTRDWFADCDLADPDTWGAPPEVHDLVVTRLPGGETEVAWDSLDAVVGKSGVYDLVRGTLASLVADQGFVSAECRAHDVVDTPFLDLDPDPAPGEGFYYLVRGRNSCASGTFGDSSLDPDPTDVLDAGFCQGGVCGDEVINLGESCDGSNLGNGSCESLGYQGGTLLCDASCDFDTTSCDPGICGDEIVDPGEQCDASNLDGATCVSRGFDGGTLACDASCAFDEEACTACGDAICEGDEECDENDLCGETCQTLGYLFGGLRCSSQCTFDTRLCNNCGDGQIQPGEDCDGVNLGGETCVTLGYLGGTLACQEDCDFDTTGCTLGN
jgi:hypothetical protein